MDDIKIRPEKDSKPETKTSQKPVIAEAALGTTHPQDKNKVKVPPHKRLKWVFFKPEHISLKRWLLFDAAFFICLAIAASGGYYLFKHVSKLPPPPPQVSATKRPPPKPKTEPSHLTGLQVDPNLNLRPVTGVMIENSPDARPQSGLTDAGVVVEAIAEGGITRFLALYREAQPDYIGPVRSVRPYYLDFALAFNASVAHVGGSPEALGQVKGLGVRDLDEFANAGAYMRITQRYAPHNVYTSMAKLDALNKARGYTSSTFTSFPRKKDQPSTQPTARSVDMAISSFFYNAHYDYDATTNTYKRSEGGKPHVDEKSGQQISPKVLVALVMNYSIQSDGKHSNYGTVGSGAAYVFQDGIVTTATWSKSSRSAQLTLTDANNGQPVKLNAGQTWIALVANAGKVTYGP